MKKMILDSFESTEMSVREMNSASGGVNVVDGRTKTIGQNTQCTGTDHDNGLKDYDAVPIVSPGDFFPLNPVNPIFTNPGNPIFAEPGPIFTNPILP